MTWPTLHQKNKTYFLKILKSFLFITMQFGREWRVSRSVPCRSSVFLCSEITQKRLLRKLTRHRLRTTKETTQQINKAPGRTLFSGSFISFVMTVPTERRNNLLLWNLHDYKKATRGDWFLPTYFWRFAISICRHKSWLFFWTYLLVSLMILIYFTDFNSGYPGPIGAFSIYLKCLTFWITEEKVLPGNDI